MHILFRPLRHHLCGMFLIHSFKVSWMLKNQCRGSAAVVFVMSVSNLTVVIVKLAKIWSNSVEPVELSNVALTEGNFHTKKMCILMLHVFFLLYLFFLFINISISIDAPTWLSKKLRKTMIVKTKMRCPFWYYLFCIESVDDNWEKSKQTLI